MHKLVRVALYLASFGLARGTLFFAPILLANLLPADTYGSIEWAHAAGSFTASILAVGTGSALPLIRLTQSGKGSVNGVYAHHLLLVLCCLAAMLVLFVFADTYAPALAALLTAAVALQALWSVQLKSSGRGEASLVLDAGLFGLLALTAAGLKYMHVLNAALWLMSAIALYVSGLLFVTVRSFLARRRQGELLAYFSVLQLGWPLMIAAMVTIAATTSGRLVIGYLGGSLLTADYAILARAAALPIVAHQVILVAKFRDIYVLPDRDVERIIAIIMGAVAATIVGLWVLSSSLGWMLGPAFVKGFTTDPRSAILILSQAILWSAISMNDMVCTRTQNMLRVLPWSTTCLVVSVFTGVIFVRHWGVSLAHFVIVHCFIMLAFYLSQVFGMIVSGIRMWRAWIFAVVVFSLLSVSACALYS